MIDRVAALTVPAICTVTGGLACVPGVIAIAHPRRYGPEPVPEPG
jgi:hypothetical protein